MSANSSTGLLGLAPNPNGARGINILDALDDPNVFAPHVHGASWDAWRAFLAALFGLPLTPSQMSTYRECTQREVAPDTQAKEAWLVIGRRGGKSFTLALIAVFLAAFKDWRPFLGPGERGTIMIVAGDRKQARTILRYITGLLKGVPMLAQLVEAERQEAIDLTNRISIEVHTASFRSVRGYTVVAALCDEIAFWPTDDSANPDTEVIAALRPAMATVPGAMMLCASSPYARRGALWRAYQAHHGKGPILVWQAETRRMNPNVPQSLVDEVLAEDAAKASAEYLAQFRTDIESFVSREAIEACISSGIRERAPDPNTLYSAFVDPSGGSSDSFTLAIAHGDDDRVVLDLVREITAPFSPEAAVSELAAALRSYRVFQIRGDRYGGLWPREAFVRHGIEYWTSDKSKSDLYQALLPAINSANVDLLDLDRLTTQLVSLERRTARGGRDSIDHPPGAHDDIANAVAGAADLVLGQPEQTVSVIGPILMHGGEAVSDTFGLDWLKPSKPSRVDLTDEFGGPMSRRPG